MLAELLSELCQLAHSEMPQLAPQTHLPREVWLEALPAGMEVRKLYIAH